jgi:hypothetical protein
MKKIVLLLACSLSAQNSYNGQITFDYNGTVNGSFSSMTQDSISSGFAFNQIGEDTSYFLMASITEQDNDEFDLFIAIIQDTTFPIQPRIWDIPGSGDENNPLSLETILILMPGLDSSFVVEIFGLLTDTTNSSDSLALNDFLSDIFLELSDDLYLGLGGELEITNATDSLIIGNFNSTLFKPVFHFPPHILSINNGEFIFNQLLVTELAIPKQDIIPRSAKLYPAYPNPFNPSTIIQFSIAERAQDISLLLYDVNGRNVETIYSGPLDRGTHEFPWHAKGYSSGVYFAVLKTKKNFQSTKLILMK